MGKFVPVHVMKACRWRRDTTPSILDLGNRWGWVVNFASRPIYLSQITPVPTT